MCRALIILLGLLSAVTAQKSFKSVAIVGGGVGAASAALHLRELVGEDLDIDVCAICIFNLLSKHPLHLLASDLEITFSFNFIFCLQV
jgi:hypothetical protein